MAKSTFLKRDHSQQAAITPDTAFRLARFFDTTPEFWLGLQTAVSMWDILQAHGGEDSAYKAA